MKKLSVSLAVIAAAALTLVSCTKEITQDTPSADGIDVTIVAGSPVTKTALGSNGETPYWKDGDALSVTNGTSSNVSFMENSIADGETALIASFSGKVSEAGDYYAVYPYTGTIADGKGPRVNVPTEQHPTATSFDGAADIMVSKQFSVGVTTNTTIENLQFARCGAIIKLVFSGKAAAQQTKLADQHPVSVSLTSDSDLVGNVVFDYENGTASILSTASKTVSATYTTSTQYLINGTNATYLIVVPTTLSGTLEVEATTEDYEISRTLTLPDDIELEAGKVYTFNVKLGDASIADATPVQALPWSNDFSWHTTTTESNYTTNVTTQSIGEFTGGSYIYGAKEVGAIRIGNGSNPGAITTKLMNLSGAFKVTVSAKAYNTGDGSKVTVTVGDVTKIADATLGSAYSDYVFNFDAGQGTAKSPLTIGTDKKRAVITSVSVEAVDPHTPSISVSPATSADSPVEWAADNDDAKTFTVTATNGTWEYDASGVSTWAIVTRDGDVLTVTPRMKQANENNSGSIVITLTPTQSGYENQTATIYLSQAKYSSGDEPSEYKTTVTASMVTGSSVSWTGTANETWSVSVSGGATNQNVTNGYAQIGTSKSPSQSITISTSGIEGTIKSITINCASYNGIGTVSATVKGSAFGTQSQGIPRWSNNAGGDITFSGSASGPISIVMTNGDGGRAMYIKSITVAYEK